MSAVDSEVQYTVCAGCYRQGMGVEDLCWMTVEPVTANFIKGR